MRTTTERNYASNLISKWNGNILVIVIIIYNLKEIVFPGIPIMLQSAALIDL